MDERKKGLKGGIFSLWENKLSKLIAASQIFYEVILISWTKVILRQIMRNGNINRNFSARSLKN